MQSEPKEPRSERTDEQLVASAQDGDLEAFDELIGRYKQRIYATVYHMTGNRDDAEDLTQETFIRAYRALGKFRGRSSFYTWIYRIAVNLTVNFLKKNRRLRETALDDLNPAVERDPDYERLLRSEPSPRKQVSLREFQERLNEALQKLSEAHRMVVTLHDIQGVPHGEIARIMGCSEGTVRSRLFYARQQLRGYLSEYVP